MPVFRLPETFPKTQADSFKGADFFPPVDLAEPDGLLAVGGDLTPDRLIAAYKLGIFPWYNDEDPILWWSPNPRSILKPAEAYQSKSMGQFMRRTNFVVKTDTAFAEVVQNCAQAPRRGQEGSWITQEMKEAYIELHKLGVAHSIETWDGDTLVGGLYGLAMGGCFFGESMFSKVSNASKMAFLKMAKWLDSVGYVMIDCQVPNPHLISLGAREVPRLRFIRLLEAGLAVKPSASWADFTKWSSAES